MQAPRYFFLLDNFFKKPDNRALVDDLILTLSHRPHCYKLPLPCTHRPHCHQYLIPMRFHPPAPSWYYHAPAITRGKRHKSSIFLAIQIYRLVCLLGTELEKVQKTLPPTSGFIWSWYICCSTKFYYWKNSF